MRTILVAACLGAAGILGYFWASREPTPIKLDPAIYDDYAGHYDFGNNYVITLRRDGDRLMSSAPERMPEELFPETPSTFFVKGQPLRVRFHRSTSGQVDYVIFQWKK